MPEYRGLGLGAEAMKRILLMAKKIGLKDIESEVFSHNVPSIKLMLDAGFTFYGPIYQVKKVL